MSAFPQQSAMAWQAAAVAAPDILTNDKILRLVAAGLPDQTIIAKIRASKSAFDLSTDQLIALKNKGVSGAVLATMLEPAPAAAALAAEMSIDSGDTNVPHYPGVYMYGAESQTMTRILASASDQAKTGGIIGYALTAGIASASIKAAIPGKSAKVRTRRTRPAFYFFFDESVPRALQGNGASIWMSGAGSITSSPGELSLVRFDEKAAAREARVGSMNIAGAKTGVMDKDRIAFETEEVRPGVFKVTPSTDLAPGEYGFIQTLSGGNGGRTGAMSARVFDFGIVPAF
ncbi:MAG: hypothetical protein H7267_09040 [Sandarakinorhabdus sp.]|nr:hypothetical protein [Sandarakinorhabdus sp.]